MSVEMEMIQKYMTISGYGANYNHVKWSYKISSHSENSEVISGELASKYISIEAKRRNKEKYLNSYCLAA